MWQCVCGHTYTLSLNVSICVNPGGNSLRCLMHERQMKNELNTVASYMDQKANYREEAAQQISLRSLG